jgi:hypothetical protein
MPAGGDPAQALGAALLSLSKQLPCRLGWFHFLQEFQGIIRAVVKEAGWWRLFFPEK